MKNKIFIAALILLSFFCSPKIVLAQQESRGTSVRFNESGILVEFKTETDPPQSGNQFEVSGTTHIRGERNITHRIFVDQTTGGTFGYDLEVQPSTVANHFMLTIKPLSIEKSNIKPLKPKAAPVKPLSIQGIPVEQVPTETKDRIVQNATKIGNSQPSVASVNNATVVTDGKKIENAAPVSGSSPTKYPPAFLIEDGGTFALDVLVNPQTGVKIVDLIKISSGTKLATSTKESQSVGGAKELQPMSSAGVLQPMRDFTPDAVELSVQNFKFLINEQIVLGADNPIRGGVSGAIIWIYLPGHGRFIFSLTPREGYDFQKIGIIQSNKISFQIEGDRYEWISNTPIFSGDWNLWVLHDADYSPKNELFTAGGYQIGAADRIEYLLKKK